MTIEEVFKKNLPNFGIEWLQEFCPDIYEGLIKSMTEYQQIEREKHSKAIDILRGIYKIAFDPDDPDQWELCKKGETELQKHIKEALNEANYKL